MATPSTLTQIERSDAGTGANSVVATGGNVTLVDFDDRIDTIETGRGVDRKVGFRMGMTWRYHNIDKFQALNTAQKAGTAFRFTFTFDGPVNYQVDPVFFTVVPVIGELPDKCNVEVAPAGTDEGVNPPGAAPWVDLGRILAGSSPSFSVVTEDDGCGLPIYVRTEFEWTMDFVNENSANLDPYYNTEAKIAVDHGDGTFTYFDNVLITNLPATGSELVTTQAILTASYADVETGVIIPGGWATPTAPAFFNGCEVDGAASGDTQGDVLTIT